LVIHVASLSESTHEDTAQEIQRLANKDSMTSNPDAEIAAKANRKEPGDNGGSSHSTRDPHQQCWGTRPRQKAEASIKQNLILTAPFCLQGSFEEAPHMGLLGDGGEGATAARRGPPLRQDKELLKALGHRLIALGAWKDLAMSATMKEPQTIFEYKNVLGEIILDDYRKRLPARQPPPCAVKIQKPLHALAEIPCQHLASRPFPFQFYLETIQSRKDFKKIEHFSEEDQGPVDNPSPPRQAIAPLEETPRLQAPTDQSCLLGAALAPHPPLTGKPPLARQTQE
ncbi:hypothetical protein J0S82_002218, partial [Galemys pyrenaicus]